MSSQTALPVSLDRISLPPQLPPLVLIAFTRPDLLKEVIAAISQQSLLPQKIITFVDGARTAKDIPLIEECVDLLKELERVALVKITLRAQNLGCDRNIILGLSEVLSSHDSLVYLEDDTVPNTYFYDRMCRLLEAYRDCQQVCSVSAYAHLPAGLDPLVPTDFMVSNRVFSWGFGTWRDRWQEIDLAHKPPQYNPFGSFYQIPATLQTKLTILNQFWLEKKYKTDWVITFTLAALYHHKVHIVPTYSFTRNIGFGHAQSKTYRGKEQTWVNARYRVDAYPNSLPSSLDLINPLKQPLSDTELARYFLKHKGLWLSPRGFLYLLQKSSSFRGILLLSTFFVTRFILMLKHWRKERVT
ncbi:MAG: sugar transferase [Cyanobacteriota bacterium]|nr:sugar transferase [Cyanobacteriota bacterium]